MISETTSQLFTAISAAQSKIFGVERNREVTVKMRNKPDGGGGGSYKFAYATLDNIIHHIRQPLVDNGLWFVQMVRDGQMVTRIIHASGEYMDCGVPMPDIKGSPQDIGSIISYFKRYSLAAAFGIVTEEDEDDEQGDRELAFSAFRRNAPANAEPEIEEPPMGWGDFTRGLITTIGDKASGAELDELRDANKRYINSLARIDRGMYGDIGAAFAARRAVVDKNAGF